MPLSILVIMPYLVRCKVWKLIWVRKFASAGIEAWLTPRNTPLPMRVTLPNCIALGNMGIRRRNGPFVSRISRSLKVIGTDTDRSDIQTPGDGLHSIAW